MGDIHRKRKSPTEETKLKMRLSNLGKKRSEETKRKMSITRTGLFGIRCNSWKGGSNNEKIRSQKQYKLWRKQCIERDNFTCQITGQTGGELDVHHLNNFADFPEFRFNIDNGITLSKNIHKLFHKIYGRKNNTKEQLTEFIKNIDSKEIDI